jgi:Acyl-CoA thioesterase C-terminal domain/Acyl-CoA thioesterase N-terminal domain
VNGDAAAAIPEAIALPIERSGSEKSLLNEYFDLTPLARGPWQPDAAHGGAPAALLVRAAEVFGGDGMRLASLNCTFNGPVTLGEIGIEAEVTKPGRRQKVVSLKLSTKSRTLIDARAVLIRRGDVRLPAGIEAPTPSMRPPEEGQTVKSGTWASGKSLTFFGTANTIRMIEGGIDRTGPRGAGWFRLEYPVVPGETPSGAQRAAAAADFGNGLAHPVAFGEYLFINCDLNLSLYREPAGDWIGVESETEVDRVGTGLTVSRLHDVEGPFGAASQTLFVERTGGH